jgi:replicative DNA helicase
MAGTGLSAMGMGAAGLGSSKLAIAHAVSSPLSFAATVGVGILAAGTLNKWMSKRESNRRQREAQQFHDAFTMTTQVLEALTQAQTLSNKAAQRQLLQQALEQINVFKGQALKRQDPQLKEYVQLLSDRFQTYLRPASTPLRNLQRLFTSRVS